MFLLCSYDAGSQGIAKDLMLELPRRVFNIASLVKSVLFAMAVKDVQSLRLLTPAQRLRVKFDRACGRNASLIDRICMR
ncbi:hypothetical protein ATO67_18955 [Agrobacterium bohemicum]|uniref:Uncharacterized protein n=1 Tax=Agrobacterium bohemicum TaxID=2052828 RepID=A0A135P7M4_9HYPH|nr:hypothetical protein ATO67_18955 [Agrobacterium bohemicum]